MRRTAAVELASAVLMAMLGLLWAGSLDAGAVTSRRVADFDNDAKTDRSFFRLSSGGWYVHQSGGGDTGVIWGLANDVPAVGDYDGDGKADTAIFRPSSGLWAVTASGGGTTFTTYGGTGDIAVPADYDGDGKADIAVYRPSTGTWFVHNSSGGDTATTYGGIVNDIPVPADYDGDGKADVAIVRRGTWLVHPSGGGADTAVHYGLSHDTPVVGDYDSDGKADVALWRPSTGLWAVHLSAGGDTSTTYGGLPGDVPAPGDYDGDGKTDLSVLRPNDAWYVHQSSDSTDSSLFFGAAGDEPLPLPAAVYSVLQSPPNFAPEAQPASASTNEDAAVDVVLKATDDDGNNLTFGVVGAPAHGSLGAVSSPSCDSATPRTCTATVHYTPSADYNGSDSFTFKANDGTVDGDPGTASLAVNSVNDAPTFTKGADQTVLEDAGAQTVSAWASAISPGPANESSQTTSFSVTGNTNPGMFSAAPAVSSTGALTYTSAPDANGTATITLKLSDNGGTANGGVDNSSQTFVINVTAVNDAPRNVTDVSHGVTGNVRIQVAAGGGLLVGVTDVEGDTLAAQVDASNASTGNVVINADGSYSYDPKVGTTGSDTVKFKVCDGGSPSACSAVHNLNLTVSNMIWFIDNSKAAAGNGRLTAPFNSIANFVAVNDGAAGHAKDNDPIFVDRAVATDYTGPMTLRTGQKLFGKGATATIPVLTGVTFASDSDALPSTSGTAPRIVTSSGTVNGITLGSGNTVRGLSVGDTTGAGISGSSFGTLTVSETAIGPSRAGQALNLNTGTANGTLTNVSSTSSATAVSLTTVTGSLTMSAGAISGATGTDFVVNGGSSGTITYNGTINNTAGRSVDVQNRSGTSTVAFGGSITDTGQGVFLNANTGGTINFTGGLSVSTGANAAFTATGGGTVNVTGSNNVLSTTTGTALNVSSTTIGASGLTFKSISSNGAANGILLNNTGSSGGLTVAGTGAVGSGGTIKNSTDSGVQATNTTNLNLSWMTVQDNGNALNEGGLRLVDVFGTGQLTSSTVTGGFEDNVYMSNSSGTLSGFLIQGPNCSIGNNNSSSGNTGISVLATLTSNMNVTINNCSFSGNRSDTIHTDTADSSTLTATITNNVITAGSPNQGNIGIDVSSALTSTLTYDVENNKIGTNGTTDTPLLNHGINVFAGNNSTASGKLIGNTIAMAGAGVSGTGIRIFQSDSGTLNAKVDNNVVRNVGLDFGIDATDNGSGTGTSTGKLNVGLTNNNVSVLSAAINAIRVRGRRDTTTCARITTNTATTNNGGSALSISQANTATYKFEIAPPPPLGALTDAQAQSELASLNTGTAEAFSASGSGITGVAASSCTGIPS